MLISMLVDWGFFLKSISLEKAKDKLAGVFDV